MIRAVLPRQRGENAPYAINACDIRTAHQEIRMGRGDNRQTPKMKRRRSQAKLKARIKRKIETAKAAKKPAAPAKKK